MTTLECLLSPHHLPSSESNRQRAARRPKGNVSQRDYPSSDRLSLQVVGRRSLVQRVIRKLATFILGGEAREFESGRRA